MKMQKMTKIWVITLVIAIILFVVGVLMPIPMGGGLSFEAIVSNALILLSFLFFIIWIIESLILIGKKCCKKK